MTTKPMQEMETDIGRPLSLPDVWSIVAATLLAAFYLAASLYIASHRLLWFDEDFTVHIARLPDLATIFTALGHGSDTMPPAYHIVVRIFDKLFGHSEVAARLPSALALVAGLLITFDCARRLTDGLHGLIALSLVTCSFVPTEGFEARSYAFYFMFAALALWVWTCTRADKKWSAILFGAVLFLAVLFHYYAILLLVPYALWEVLRWRPWRPPSPKLIAGVVGVVASAALMSPFAMAFSRNFSAGFWSRPSLRTLAELFPQMFPNGLFPLALIVIGIVLMNNKTAASRPEPMPSAESLGWLFLCTPLVAFVLAEVGTNAFALRYLIGVLPGVAVACSCCAWRHFRNATMVSVGILLILLTCGVAKQLYMLRHPDSFESPVTKGYLSLERSLRDEGKRYFVFSNPFVFLEAQYYSKYPDDCILLLPSDLSQKAGSTHSSLDPYSHQRHELILSQYYPLRFWQDSELREHAQEAALIQPTPQVVEAMKQFGFKVESRVSEPLEIAYLK